MTRGAPRPSRCAPLDGCAAITLEDVAPAKWTKQSTAASAEGTYALPTCDEASPWWEIDLGKNLVLESLIAWIEPLALRARVVCTAFSVADPRGDPPPGAIVRELDSRDLVLASDGSQVISLAFDVVARFVRVQLHFEGEPGRLAIRGMQIFGASVFGATLAETYQRAFTLFAGRPLFSAREAPGRGAFQVTHLYRDVWEAARRLSFALARRLELLDGEREGERVFLGLCTKNRAEWFIAEVAAVLRGYVIVPLSPDDPDDRLRAIISRCPVRAVVCEGSSVAALATIAQDHPSLRLLLAVGDVEPRAAASVTIASFDALAAEVGPAPGSPSIERDQDDLYTLLFTSGSTGVPKGAMRSYRKFNAMLASYGVAQPAYHLSFQPLSHLSERHYLPAVIMNGSLVGWSSGGAHLLSDLAEFRPSWVSSVPRLYDVLYAGYKRSLAAALAADPSGDPGAIEASVLASRRGAFGDRVQGVSTGSAPVNPEVFAFLRRCFSDLWVMDGYGSTEVGTITFDNKISPNVEVRLEPLDGDPGGREARRPGEPERGEIWVRSPHVIDGYYGDEEASAKSLDRDGFFRTGDIGERTADGGVRVIGRVSASIKLAQGEFVSVDRVEAELSSCPLVDRLFVHPDATSSSLVAVVVPSAAALAEALGDPGLGAAEAASRPEAPRLVLSALRERAREVGLAGHEIPRAVVLDPEPMTVASGLLTASGKLSRRAAIERYKERIAAIDAASTAPPPRAADRGDLARRIAAIAGSIVQRDVSPDERLSDGIGQDSLTSAEVLHAISEELGFTVPLAWWFEASSVAELARLIERRPGDAPSSGANDLLDSDRRLQFTVDRGAAPARFPADRALLTGATGLVGAHLLEELARSSGAHVVCLARASSDAEARARVSAALDRYRIPALDPDRWSAVAGDLAAPRLGLSDARWSALSGDIAVVVHAGASVNWMALYAELRAPNVLGTAAILELAATGRRKPIHYISTISTAPADGDESTALTFEQALAGSAYGLSKWVAEGLVRRAGEAGHPVTIYRPGLVVGHSARGVGNEDDFVHRYLSACVRYGVYLDRPERLDMTPVDYVSRAVVAELGASPVGGGVLHLCNVEQSMRYAELGRALAARRAPCAPVDYAAFRAAAVKPKDSPLRPLASYFPEAGFALGSGPWPSSATRERLAALSVRCPRIEPQFVELIAASLRRQS